MEFATICWNGDSIKFMQEVDLSDKILFRMSLVTYFFTVFFQLWRHCPGNKYFHLIRYMHLLFTQYVTEEHLHLALRLSYTEIIFLNLNIQAFLERIFHNNLRVLTRQIFCISH